MDEVKCTTADRWRSPYDGNRLEVTHYPRSELVKSAYHMTKVLDMCILNENTPVDSDLLQASPAKMYVHSMPLMIRTKKTPWSQL